MDYSSGEVYGYDQISPNMMGDNYDAAYSPSATNGRPASCANQAGHRTLLPPQHGARPIMSLSDSIAKPRRPLDSEIIGRPRETECFGCPRALGGARMPMDMNAILLLFVFVLIIVVVINSINLRHLAKQVKILTRREMAAAPALPTK